MDSNPRCFSERELSEIETVFGLFRINKPEPEPERLRIRDGEITFGEQCWWRSDRGPEFVMVTQANHRTNILEFPYLYSFAKPVVIGVLYKD